jgi:hypothetical protein
MGRCVSEKTQVGQEAGSLLLEYTLKALLVAGLCELILYRLISRLGMHLSKVAREYVVVEYFLRGTSSIGFVLLNFSAILVFMGLFIFLFSKMREPWIKSLDRIIVMLVSALVALTVSYLLFPPVMLGSVAYSALTALVVWAIVVQYAILHPSLKARAMIVCYGLGVSGWLYYQTTTTLYSWLGFTVSPPLVHEFNRLGEALLVAATALVFAVYGGFSMRTKNLRQRKRTAWYVGTWAALFVGLLLMDSVLELVDPEAARSVRQSSQGIGWIFQMGMGYTFYLPFAFYVAGLLF